ncbi:MAG TPA: bacterial proteasome activator family protein [Aeromicrobium sp.]|nr:bacterial proteasome activator family protein [Aeromicrobium sp.]
MTDVSPETSAPDQRDDSPQIIGPDGSPVLVADESSGTPLQDLVEQPAKVMRIGSMIRQLLEEVKASPLDEKSRARLREIHEQSIKELEDGLAPELIEELDRLSLPFSEDAPSEPELRIAQAQLVGWLEGLFHGIQAALYAQQMQAQSQLHNMRLALPHGEGVSNDAEGNDSTNSDRGTSHGGMYL